MDQTRTLETALWMPQRLSGGWLKIRTPTTGKVEYLNQYDGQRLDEEPRGALLVPSITSMEGGIMSAEDDGFVECMGEQVRQDVMPVVSVASFSLGDGERKPTTYTISLGVHGHTWEACKRYSELEVFLASARQAALVTDSAFAVLPGKLAGISPMLVSMEATAERRRGLLGDFFQHLFQAHPWLLRRKPALGFFSPPPLALGEMLVVAAEDGDLLALLDLLDREECPVDARGSRTGRGAMHEVAVRGDVEMATHLVRAGARIDLSAAPGGEGDPLIGGWAAMHFCCAHGHTAMLDLLLDHGADPNHTSKSGLTPLLIAAQWNQTECALRLLASPRCRQGHFTELEVFHGIPISALHLACQHGNVILAARLVELPAFPKSSRMMLQGRGPASSLPSSSLAALRFPEDGWTCLHWAAQSGHMELSKRLVALGADPTAVAVFTVGRVTIRRTPAAIAREFGFHELANFLSTPSLYHAVGSVEATEHSEKRTGDQRHVARRAGTVPHAPALLDPPSPHALPPPLEPPFGGSWLESHVPRLPFHLPPFRFNRARGESTESASASSAAASESDEHTRSRASSTSSSVGAESAPSPPPSNTRSASLGWERPAHPLGADVAGMPSKTKPRRSRGEALTSFLLGDGHRHTVDAAGGSGPAASGDEETKAHVPGRNRAPFTRPNTSKSKTTWWK
uniref:PX domain-containing protein n=1 Tax=Rhizochromulina marina TaxID=1034831 RepID=A0A7S2WBA0_9STRA